MSAPAAPATHTPSTPPATDKLTVLVVDDTPDNLTLLNGLLRDSYRVKVANSGARALTLAQMEPQPDLILLDIMMPEMDGYEVLQQLRAQPATADTPVIFITALNDGDSEVKGLELGAVDYITKPFNPPVVHARLATHLALRTAQRELADSHRRLLTERTIVEEVIECLRSHRAFNDRHLRFLLAPLERSNGDLLLATATPDGRQWVLLGDFTGHGLPAAVAAPLVGHIFYGAASRGERMESMLAEINATLCAQLPIHMFMVLGAVEISPDRRQLRLWNAGLPAPLLLTASGASQVSTERMLPLGIIPDLDLAGSAVNLDLPAASRLVLYSDGISETANPAGEQLGEAGVADLLASLPATTPLDALLTHLTAFHGGPAFHDDMTLVEISVGNA